MRFAHLLITVSFFISQTSFPFFPAETLIKTVGRSLRRIDQIGVPDMVACMQTDGKTDLKPVTHKHMRRTQRYIVIVFDNDEIITTLDQKMYAPTEKIFKNAEQFKIGDMLLAYSGEQILIRDIQYVEGDQEFFDITVDECHNFFVSRSEVLVHNMIPVAVGLSWVFGGGLQFAGASLMTPILGSIVALQWDKNKKREIAFACDGWQHNNEHEYHCNDAQAPGKPTEKDGYVPPKKWDGKKVKHPKTGQHGYPDKSGNVWVPTGPGPLAHRGPHWDVIDKTGKKHKNVLPGGRIC